MKVKDRIGKEDEERKDSWFLGQLGALLVATVDSNYLQAELS